MLGLPALLIGLTISGGIIPLAYHQARAGTAVGAIAAWASFDVESAVLDLRLLNAG